MRRAGSAKDGEPRLAAMQDSIASQVLPAALRCAVHAPRKPSVAIELRYPAALKPGAYIRVRPCDTCVAPLVTRRTHTFDPWTDLQRSETDLALGPLLLWIRLLCHCIGFRSKQHRWAISPPLSELA
jgi:hypothetical protein